MGPMPFMGQYVFCVHYYEILHFIYFPGMSLHSISFVIIEEVYSISYAFDSHQNSRLHIGTRVTYLLPFHCFLHNSRISKFVENFVSIICVHFKVTTECRYMKLK